MMPSAPLEAIVSSLAPGVQDQSMSDASRSCRTKAKGWTSFRQPSLPPTTSAGGICGVFGLASSGGAEPSGDWAGYQPVTNRDRFRWCSDMTQEHIDEQSIWKVRPCGDSMGASLGMSETWCNSIAGACQGAHSLEEIV